jgi:23S rRNA U2552 (ribose-2'-O)-methylase RlmE/FtsJ
MQDIFYISKFLNKKWVTGFKQLGNSPKPLTKKLYIEKVLPNIQDYIVTEKADGLRSFLMIKQTVKYITAEKTEYLNIKWSLQGEYIFDCEYVNNTLLIFDVIVYNDTNVSMESFNNRLAHLLEFKTLLTKNKITNIKVKEFYTLNSANYQKTIMNLYMQTSKKKSLYNIDGLIFIEKTQNYNNTQNLKWKPPEFLTIDFLAIKNTTQKSPNKYILLNGIQPEWATRFGFDINSDKFNMVKEISHTEKYMPVPFYNSLKPNIYHYTSTEREDLHMHIIELSLDKNMNWIFHRIRNDRDPELKNGSYFGNNYKVAETVLISILNPLSIKDLVSNYNTLTKDMYFHKQDKSYEMVKKFNNYVKNTLIQRYKNSDNIIELGSGRGGDLYKYVNANIKNLLMLEYDINAIDETIERKYNILTKPYNTGCNLVTLQMDLNANFKKNITLIEDSLINSDEFVNNKVMYKKGATSTIFCNFAMHYFLTTALSTKNIVQFISHYLKPGGSFIMTIFDGNRVFNLLKQNKGKWETLDKKYMIEYIGKQPNVFSGFGNMINVLLPLANKPYREPLIDLFQLDKIFKQHSISRVEERNFDSLLTNQNMDHNDITFISLYKYVIYRRT